MSVWRAFSLAPRDLGRPRGVARITGCWFPKTRLSRTGFQKTFAEIDSEKWFSTDNFHSVIPIADSQPVLGCGSLLLGIR